MTDTAEQDDRSLLQLLLHIRERDFSRTVITGREARGGDYCIRLWPEDFEQIVDALSRLKPMTDTAALIEQLREAIAYERTLSAPAEHSIACMEDAIQALSRLTAPPPEEIAGLIGKLERRNGIWANPEKPGEWIVDEQIAAALRSLAMEVERLKDDLRRVRSVYDFAAQEQRIRELEAERDKWKIAETTMSAAYVRLRRIIPGALDTPYAPAPEQVWVTTEEAARQLVSERNAIPEEPTEAMLVAARDWSYKKYGKSIGNDAASGCWKAMFAAICGRSNGTNP